MQLTIITPENLTNIQTHYQAHPHHLTQESPWPILTSGAVLSMLSSMALWFNGLAYSGTLLTLGMLSTASAMILWWADVVKEGTYIGTHTKIVQQNHTLGVSLFIVTEACFFLSIFWAYFHSSLAPTVDMGCQWPPAGVTALSPTAVPLLNTILLVSSGATITYSHHAIFRKNRGAALLGIALTVLLAVVFTALQWLEYDVAGFSMSDGAFGSCFYFSTGTHGVHVIVGTLAIAVSIVRLALHHFTSQHHVGLEGSIVYFHFVDVVWLFLYFAVYCWGSYLKHIYYPLF